MPIPKISASIAPGKARRINPSRAPDTPISTPSGVYINRQGILPWPYRRYYRPLGLREAYLMWNDILGLAPGGVVSYPGWSTPVEFVALTPHEQEAVIAYNPLLMQVPGVTLARYGYLLNIPHNAQVRMMNNQPGGASLPEHVARHLAIMSDNPPTDSRPVSMNGYGQFTGARVAKNLGVIWGLTALIFFMMMRKK